MATQKQDLWIDHSDTCRHCGLNRSRAIAEVTTTTTMFGRTTSRTSEITLCSKCRAKFETNSVQKVTIESFRLIAERA